MLCLMLYVINSFCLLLIHFHLQAVDEPVTITLANNLAAIFHIHFAIGASPHSWHDMLIEGRQSIQFIIQ